MNTFTEVAYYDARDREIRELSLPINRFEVEILISPLRHLIEESAEAIDKLPQFVVEQTLRPIRDLYDRLEACREQFIADETVKAERESEIRAERESEIRAEVDRDDATPADGTPGAVAAAVNADGDEIPF
ncbi:MAG TPA: hypothetical protein VEW95_09290 [Candidatus Limnocylindrales bacterium]|nr:hypothetical protein [Candidatus Limnocylindrales bacterium]